jgi:hypothetical protein
MRIPLNNALLPLIERRAKTRCGKITFCWIFCCIHEKCMPNKGGIKLSAENDPESEWNGNIESFSFYLVKKTRSSYYRNKNLLEGFFDIFRGLFRTGFIILCVFRSFKHFSLFDAHSRWNACWQSILKWNKTF